MKSSNLTRTSSLLILGTLALLPIKTVSAEEVDAALDPTDMVAVSFWLATAMMLASTVFFVLERNNVDAKWKTSMTVAALVTGVAWYHYTYMREHWSVTTESPLVLRYVDWLITVPLLIIELLVVLGVSGETRKRLMKSLLPATVLMIGLGYPGEISADSGTKWLFWVLAMIPFAFILWTLYGQLKAAATRETPAVAAAIKGHLTDVREIQ